MVKDVPEPGRAALVGNLADSEILNRYPELINLIAGKLRSTFQAEAWAPGEIRATMLTTPAEIAAIGEDGFFWTVNDKGENVKKVHRQALHILMYGEAPGSILFDGYLNGELPR